MNLMVASTIRSNIHGFRNSNLVPGFGIQGWCVSSDLHGKVKIMLYSGFSSARVLHMKINCLPLLHDYSVYF